MLTAPLTRYGNGVKDTRGDNLPLGLGFPITIPIEESTSSH